MPSALAGRAGSGNVLFAFLEAKPAAEVAPNVVDDNAAYSACEQST